MHKAGTRGINSLASLLLHPLDLLGFPLAKSGQNLETRLCVGLSIRLSTIFTQQVEAGWRWGLEGCLEDTQ